LSADGYAVRFFQSVEALNRAIRIARAGIVIISDNGNSHEVIEAIKILSESPEMQGVRFILTASPNGDLAVRDFAAACAFREILPLELDRQSWLSRFNYATARQNMSTNQPVPQITMNNIAGVGVPTRIAWLTRQHIQFESRIQADANTQLNLAGPIAAALGLRSITTTVISQSKTNLRFRFSDSILASWSAPSTHLGKVDALIEQLKTVSPGPRWRIFVAVQDSDLRADALSRLRDLRFDVRVPLQRQHIIDEPKFLGPDVIIIEDNLCIGENRELFMKMMEQVDRNVPVIIVGRGLSGSSQVGRRDNSGITVLPKIPEDFSELLVRDFLEARHRNRQAAENDAVYVPADHDMSFAEVKLPARLTRLHPTMIQVAVPVNIGKFGLIKLESPSLKKILGYHPYGKVVECHSATHQHQQDQFHFTCEAIFSDVDQRSRRLIGYSLAKAVAERLVGGTAVKKLVPDDALQNPIEGQSEILGNESRRNASQAQIGIVPPVRSKLPQTINDAEGNLALKPVSYQPERIEAKIASHVDDDAEDDEELTTTKIRMPRRPSLDFAAIAQAFIDLVTSKELRYLIIFILFSIGTFSAIWSVYNVVSHYYQRSGRQYTESIQKMLEQNGPSK
jgi:hypothetical protein